MRSSSSSLVLALLVQAFVLAHGTIARAQQPEAAAEALFRAGRDASRQGDEDTACDRYRESYRLEPALGTLFNIASCELSLGHLSEAWRHFQDVAHALPANDPRVPLANEKLAELDRRLPRLTISRSSGAPETLALRLGEIELGAASFGVPLPIDPGHYVIEARAPGHEIARYEVDLAEGQQRSLEVDAGVPERVAIAPPLQANSDSAAPPTPHWQPSSAPPPPANPAVAVQHDDGRLGARRAVAYALIGTGAASLIASAVFAGLTLDRLAVVDDNCDAHTCNARGLSARQSGEAYYGGALIALGVALLSAGASTYLLISVHQAETAQQASPRVAATANLGPHFAGAALRMRF
jgi:hypothetical protein